MPVYQALGRREQGKSTLAYYMARRVRQRAIFDPRGIFTRVPSGRVDRWGELTPAWAALADGRASEIVFTPGANLEGDFDAFVDEALRWAEVHRARELAIVVDEAGVAPLLSERFQLLLRTSPKPMSLILTAHRPVDVPVLVRSLTDRWCVFATKEPRDLAILAERCSDRMAVVVPTLHAREFASWDDRGQYGTLRVHRDPGAWYVSLHDDTVTDAPLLAFRSDTKGQLAR